MNRFAGIPHLSKAILLWTCLLSNLSAVPTHELTQGFETTIGNETISLPTGSTVEVMQTSGGTAYVRHLLPSGSATLLQIPTISLRPIASAEPPKPSAPTSTESQGSPSPTPTESAKTPNKDQVTLTTSSGDKHEGKIIRLEPDLVVLQTYEDNAEDLLLAQLDDTSRKTVSDWEKVNGRKPSPPDPRVKPGSKIVLEFPQLEPGAQTNPARIQIRIPENYDPSKPSPLALFYGGGQGSDNCDPLMGLVDPKEYVLVAFPYSQSNPRPLLVIDAHKTKELIKFQKPMLERLKLLVPNTDPERRVVIGTSNGAHMIGIASCDGWDEFVDYFSHYVLHEGGGSESRNFKALRKKHVYVLMGETSPSREYAEIIASLVKAAKAETDTFLATGEGHGMGQGSKDAIQKWIAEQHKM